MFLVLRIVNLFIKTINPCKKKKKKNSPQNKKTKCILILKNCEIKNHLHASEKPTLKAGERLKL